MKAKINRGGGFRGVLDYVLSKGEKGRIVGGNLEGRSARALAAEFAVVRQLRPDIEKPVWHSSLSLPEGEVLNDQTWERVAEAYLRKVGFNVETTPYVVVRHHDTDHDHVHIVASRVGLDAEVWLGQWEARKAIEATQELEKDFGLTQTEGLPEHRAERKRATDKELNMEVRTGKASPRHTLQVLAQEAMRDSHSLSDYQQKLAAVGVELIPYFQRDGAKLSGLSYRLDDVIMKGSDLGKAYTPLSLERKGVTYEKDRDFGTISLTREREEGPELEDRNRSLEPSEDQECGRIFGDDRTLGTSDGEAYRRRAAEYYADAETEHGIGADDRRSESEHANDEEREPSPGLKPLPARDDERVGFDHAHARIVALSVTQRHDELERGDRAQDRPRRDRTLEAVKKQVQALGCDRFEIGIRNQANGQMMNREWSAEEVYQSVSWLKRMNAQGHDVYIRPAGEGHALVLVDDLNKEKIDQLKRAGLRPCASIETSPGNYQAWVKMSDQALSAEVRCHVARSLARDFGGDPNSADSRHYGRLAGFTNRKPKYEEQGRFPYVHVDEVSRTVDFGAKKRLGDAINAMDMVYIDQARENRLERLKTPLPEYSYAGKRTAKLEYQRQAQSILSRYGQDADLSRLDWMVSVSMAKRGYGPQEIERALSECSPNIQSRKAGHMEDYARRTVDKVFQLAEVQVEREHLMEQHQVRINRERDGGLER